MALAAGRECRLRRALRAAARVQPFVNYFTRREHTRRLDHKRPLFWLVCTGQCARKKTSSVEKLHRRLRSRLFTACIADRQLLACAKPSCYTCPACRYLLCCLAIFIYNFIHQYTW